MSAAEEPPVHAGPGPITTVDWVVLRARRAWRGDSASARFWDHFPLDRQAALRWAWNSLLADDPATALAQLRAEHTAQARPDLSRVHSSWWARALEGEPAAVRATVAAHLPAALAEARHDDPAHPDPAPPVADRPPHPTALAAALALWSVRLAGDRAEAPDDPPVIRALTRLDARALARLIQTVGLAKWALAAASIEGVPLSAGDGERLAEFHEALATADPRFAQVAARDVAAIVDHGDAPPLARAGLVTLARLLTAVEPYRVRWALQHLPYATARSLRVLMGPSGRRVPMLARWESDVLRVAWRRLHAEGRLPDGWPAGASPP